MTERESDIRDKTTDAAKKIGAVMVVTALAFQIARELLVPGIGLAAFGIIFERKRAKT